MLFQLSVPNENRAFQSINWEHKVAAEVILPEHAPIFMRFENVE
jgi:hypothetical protein